MKIKGSWIFLVVFLDELHHEYVVCVLDAGYFVRITGTGKSSSLVGLFDATLLCSRDKFKDGGVISSCIAGAGVSSSLVNHFFYV